MTPPPRHPSDFPAHPLGTRVRRVPRRNSVSMAPACAICSPSSPPLFSLSFRRLLAGLLPGHNGSRVSPPTPVPTARVAPSRPARRRERSAGPSVTDAVARSTAATARLARPAAPPATFSMPGKRGAYADDLCAAAGATCGPIGDGCGGSLQCGSCPTGETCGGGGVASVCGAPACTPKTCAQLGANCGAAGDGCGGQLACGTCTGGTTCGRRRDAQRLWVE